MEWDELIRIWIIVCPLSHSMFISPVPGLWPPDYCTTASAWNPHGADKIFRPARQSSPIFFTLSLDVPPKPL